MIKAVRIADYLYNPHERESLPKTPFMRTFFNNLNHGTFVAIIESMRKYKNKLACIQQDFDASSHVEPFWNNGGFPPFDAITLYIFLAESNPRYYVECGSGNSTKFASRSIRDNNLRTKIISIDPSPRSEIDSLCHRIFRIPFEDMDLHFFDELSNEDIFLLDNSHRSFPNSDVTVFFTEILPILPSNMLYALHDNFLPLDYPEEWSHTQRRFYNEQYLLASYLLGGAMGDTVYFPCCYASSLRAVRDAFHSIFNDSEPASALQHEIYGGLFWLKKGISYRALV
jgi:hypothetical protein